MGWLMVVVAAIFGWMSLSMFVAAFKEQDIKERERLMKSGIGTLVLTLMGIVFAWNSLNPPAPPSG